jgi:hypothetical protein
MVFGSAYGLKIPKPIMPTRIEVILIIVWVDVDIDLGTEAR